MEQPMVSLTLEECERQLKILKRAIHFCEHAKSSFDPTVDLMAEPTETYPGASGYAKSTMQDVVCTLETAILYS